MNHFFKQRKDIPEQKKDISPIEIESFFESVKKSSRQQKLDYYFFSNKDEMRDLTVIPSDSEKNDYFVSNETSFNNKKKDENCTILGKRVTMISEPSQKINFFKTPESEVIDLSEEKSKLNNLLKIKKKVPLILSEQTFEFDNLIDKSKNDIKEVKQNDIWRKFSQKNAESFNSSNKFYGSEIIYKERSEILEPTISLFEYIENIFANPFELSINSKNVDYYSLPLNFKDVREYQSKLKNALVDEIKASFLTKLHSEEFEKSCYVNAQLAGDFKETSENLIVVLTDCKTSNESTLFDLEKEYSIICFEGKDGMGKIEHFLGIKWKKEKDDNSINLKNMNFRANLQKTTHCFRFNSKIEKYLQSSRKDKIFKFRYFDSFVSSKREIKILLKLSLKRMPLLNELIKSDDVYISDAKRLKMSNQIEIQGFESDQELKKVIKKPITELTKFDKLQETIKTSKILNESQKEAILKSISNEKSVALIQGPPGTGKSFTLVEVVNAFLQTEIRENHKIVICTPSNGALDELIDRFSKNHKLFDFTFFLENENTKKNKLYNLLFSTNLRLKTKTKIVFDLDKINTLYNELSKLKILRIGSGFEKSSPSNFKYCLEHLTRSCFEKEDKNLINEKISILSENLRALEVLRFNSKEIQEKVRFCQIKLATYHGLLQNLLQKGNIHFVEAIMIQDCRLIFSTLNSSAKKQMKVLRGLVSNVIIDEASQATEVQTLIPLNLLPERLILIGDPCQLPATTFHPLAKKINFQRSAMERLMMTGFASSLLTIQYRMLPLIAQFPSKMFYSNALKQSEKLNDDKFLSKEIKSSIDLLGKGNAVRFFTCHGITNKERNSFTNSKEVKVVIDVVKILWAESVKDIGVISPYSGQCKRISTQLRENNIFGVEVSTVDSFQGREKSVIIISTVRSLHKSNGKLDGLGFLVDEKRLNVSITRAKYLLIIIGNEETLKQDRTWNKYFEFLEENKLIGGSGEVKNVLNRNSSHINEE